MHSSLFASLLAVYIVALSFKVIKTRRRTKIPYGDGNSHELEIVRTAQSNAVQYIPITLLLLFSLELNDGAIWLIYLFGTMMVVGRLIHAEGIMLENIKRRVLGMQVTFSCIIGLSICNIGYLVARWF